MLRQNRNQQKRLTVPSGVTSMPKSQLELSSPFSESEKKRMSWMQLGGGFGWQFGSSTPCGQFPREYKCGCLRLVILSKEHATLLCGMIVGSMLIGLELYQIMWYETISKDLLSRKSRDAYDSHRYSPYLTILEVAVSLVTIAVSLYRFEDLDII